MPTDATSPEALVLHGLNGSHREVRAWGEALAPEFAVRTPDLLGHGGRALPERITAHAMADDLAAQLEASGSGPALLIGYSFGGVVALRTALQHPQRVRAVVCVATRWHYTAATIAHSTHVLGEARLAGMPGRAAQLHNTHQPQDWREVAARLRAMLAGFAEEPPLTAAMLGAVRCPCLVITGTTDPMAPVDTTLALHRSLPRSTIATFEGSGHPLENLPMPLMRKAVLGWAGRVL